jgi:transketolase
MTTKLTERGKQIRRDTLKLGIANGIYHYGGSFSVVEILIALYDHTVTSDDRVIMSKGHAWIPQVVMLREKGLNPGFGPRLDNPEQTCLVGHPFRDPANGIWANTGSLGHGMPLGLGMAFGKKLRKEPGRIYVIVGDGETQEGTFWESLLLAKRFKLDNFTVIVDYNQIQGSGRTEDILPLSHNNLAQIGYHMQWGVSNEDGHDAPHLASTFDWCQSVSVPTLVIARTVKGRGVSFMEDNPAWHARFPNPDELEQAYEELR